MSQTQSGIYLFYKLSTRSKKAIFKTRGSGGKPYRYRPRSDLLLRLAKECNLSVGEVALQLHREREILLNDIY